MVNPKIRSYKIESAFEKQFGLNPEVIIKSPGRINVIGEHTDYNLGYVLPAAIDHYMFIAVAISDNEVCKYYSVDYEERSEVDLRRIRKTESGWLNLINGVVDQLKDRVGPFDLAFGGNIPEGAGVSSSAALCCGVAQALSDLFHLKLDKWEIAKIAQKSEHHFAGVECGIMDQFACMFGLTNHVLLLDCKRLNYEASEVNISGYRFLLINSNVKHNLESSDYNIRRKESELALRIICKLFPNVKTYQDVTPKILNQSKPELTQTLWNRAHHIVTENNRTLCMRDHLKYNELRKVGELLSSSHRSLQENYEVTCEETDFLVDRLKSEETVLGARQVGGGFGGCVLALVKDAGIEELLKRVGADYKKRYHLKISDIPIKISKGCHRLDC